MVEVVPRKGPIVVRVWGCLALLLLALLAAGAWFYWVGLERPAGHDPGYRGDISFVLVWSYAGSSRYRGPDIDVWVTDPRGQTLSSSREHLGLGPSPEGGEIDIDDRGGWGDGWGQGDGGGPERVYWPETKSPVGTYTYGVRYYIGNGIATYTLRVYKKGSLAREHTGVFASMGAPLEIGRIGNP